MSVIKESFLSEVEDLSVIVSKYLPETPSVCVFSVGKEGKIVRVVEDEGVVVAVVVMVVAEVKVADVRRVA